MRLRLFVLACPLVLLAGCATVKTTPGGASTPVGPAPPEPLRHSPSTSAFPAPDADGYRPPARLAVLLPASGSLATAGASVRDGLLAAYYAEGRRRPTLKFYDTAGSAEGARLAMDKAVAEGAELILGPLGREEVAGVFAGATPRVSVLALNRAGTVPGNSLQFALSPDEEGEAAADRLVSRGLRRVAVFVQRDDNAQRALAVFRARLQQRGGEIVSEMQVGEEIGDLAPALAGAPMQSAQAVFLAMKAAPARSLSTQLRASLATGLPRIATTQILQGATPRLDLALDGIEFPELPWLLGRRPGLPEPEALGKRLGSARGPAQRLFAFGMDAWQLVAWLDRLDGDRQFRVRGATGLLSIERDGSIRREPAWAVFSAGRPRAAAESAPGQ
jgi:hypothetical protein